MKAPRASTALMARACLRTPSSRRFSSSGTSSRARNQYPIRNATAATTGLKASREERRKDVVDQSTPPVANTSTAHVRHTRAPSSRALRKKIDCRLFDPKTRHDYRRGRRDRPTLRSRRLTCLHPYFGSAALRTENQLSAREAAWVRLAVGVEVEPCGICDDSVHDINGSDGDPVENKAARAIRQRETAGSRSGTYDNASSRTCGSFVYVSGCPKY